MISRLSIDDQQTNTPKTRRRFTPQQNQEAVDLCLHEGLSCNTVAHLPKVSSS